MGAAPEDPHAAIQSLVDALSVALRRAVLLDDPELNPLAFSRQWDIDAVRSESILSRHVSADVREALLAQGIAAATEAVHVAEDRALAMEGRVCMPVRAGGELLGYLWLLDPGGALSGCSLEPLRRAAEEIAVQLAGRTRAGLADEGALRSADEGRRAEAAATVRDRQLLVEDRVALCLVSTLEAAVPLELARRAVHRLSTGHALAGSAPEGAAVLVTLADPVVRMLPEEGIGSWLLDAVAVDARVGQSAPAGIETLHQAAHQAAVALKVARRGGPASAAVAWSSLGSDRLLAQLPEGAAADVPEPLAALLRAEPELTRTLATFLECAGDVKATATALSLHRSGVYYRLRRVEELTGLGLDRGDDRLLAHLAIRALRPGLS
jgi:PucR-like helix-turn-helix protein